MDLSSFLLGLSPGAQVVLLACLLLLTAGAVTLLLVIAFSHSATENICKVAIAITHLLKPGHILRIEHNSEFKQIASPNTEKLDADG